MGTATEPTKEIHETDPHATSPRANLDATATGKNIYINSLINIKDNNISITDDHFLCLISLVVLNINNLKPNLKLTNLEEQKKSKC
jgi:hypothetical protein